MREKVACFSVQSSVVLKIHVLRRTSFIVSIIWTECDVELATHLCVATSKVYCAIIVMYEIMHISVLFMVSTSWIWQYLYLTSPLTVGFDRARNAWGLG